MDTDLIKAHKVPRANAWYGYWRLDSRCRWTRILNGTGLPIRYASPDFARERAVEKLKAETSR